MALLFLLHLLLPHQRQLPLRLLPQPQHLLPQLWPL
ncbi:hypothetical protein os1_06290 [Comamonadaceae bacterium OS-1]|nr:hypothetical protein os1_06290 [Comamonadaceae bacterium OS-1]